MDINSIVKKYINDGYSMAEAESKACQDIVLAKISKSKFKNHITIKGGVVMHSISNSIRRATRDLDLDFIMYSLENESIIDFINLLNSVNDEIEISIEKEIVQLHHQDYDGKRIYIKITDENNNVIRNKLDIGVHKEFDIEQDDYCFDLGVLGKNISLLINSKEQIFVEKTKSLLRLGARSTRYKDLFDFYYLINNTKLNKRRLLKIFDIYVFKDSTMRENNMQDVYNRLLKIFASPYYMNNLSNPKVNWLDISVETAINSVLEYIKGIQND